MTNETDVKKERRPLSDEEAKRIMETLRYRQRDGTMQTIEDEVNFIAGAGIALWGQGIDIPYQWMFMAMGGRSIIPDFEYPYMLSYKDGVCRMVKNKWVKK